MNIATRKVPVVRLVPPVWKITAPDWWWWKIARTNANTTMPRISKNTPIVVHERDELDAEDVQRRDLDQGHDRHDPLVVERVRDVPAHQLEGRDQRQRQGHADCRDGQDPREQVDPAGEPGVGLPGQVLRPLEDRSRHR